MSNRFRDNSPNPRSRSSRNQEEYIQDRLLLCLGNEGFSCVEKGIASRLSDVDVIWTNGFYSVHTQYSIKFSFHNFDPDSDMDGQLIEEVPFSTCWRVDRGLWGR